MDVEQLRKEKDTLQASLELEKRTIQNHIDQILRLNDEIITTQDEKIKLQERIAFLEDELKKMEEGLNDPNGYYKDKMQRVGFLF